MTESYIIERVPKRIRQLGYENYHVCYKDFTLKPNSTLVIPAFNELWFIVDDPPGVVIESSYGLYDSTGTYLSDNTHEHRGEIAIENPDSDHKRLKFIQVIIVN
jgi:hypothetical protein